MALVSDTEKLEADKAAPAGTGILAKLTPLVGIVAFLLAWQLSSSPGKCRLIYCHRPLRSPKHSSTSFLTCCAMVG